MDDQELDRRIRRMLEVAQTDAPGARRWHPPTPRPNRTAGVLAAAAAVVVFGLMGFALIRGLAGSSSDDASSSATSAGGASETTSAGSSAAETTTGGATDSTAPAVTTTTPLQPLPTYDVSNCPSVERVDSSVGTIVMSALPVAVDIETPSSGVCGQTRVLIRVSLTNGAGTAIAFPGTFVLIGPGEDSVGSVPPMVLQPGVNIVDVEIDVPLRAPGAYDLFLDGYEGGGTLRILG